MPIKRNCRLSGSSLTLKRKKVNEMIAKEKTNLIKKEWNDNNYKLNTDLNKLLNKYHLSLDDYYGCLENEWKNKP